MPHPNMNTSSAPPRIITEPICPYPSPHKTQYNISCVSKNINTNRMLATSCSSSPTATTICIVGEPSKEHYWHISTSPNFPCVTTRNPRDPSVLRSMMGGNGLGENRNRANKPKLKEKLSTELWFVCWMLLVEMGIWWWWVSWGRHDGLESLETEGQTECFTKRLQAGNCWSFISLHYPTITPPLH